MQIVERKNTAAAAADKDDAENVNRGSHLCRQKGLMGLMVGRGVLTGSPPPAFAEGLLMF